MPAAERPVVLLHGLWLHATSWTPWVELFARHGYRPVAPGWPGEPETVEAAREHPEAVADRSLAEVIAHHAAVVDALPAPPVLIGHSFGGLIAQRLLADGRGAAAVAIDPAPMRGVRRLPLSTLRASGPVLRNPANRRRAVSLTAAQFRYAFGNAVPAAESDALWERWAVPSPGRPLFDAATANLRRRSPAAVDTANSRRGPLLLTMGGRDHTVPAAVTRSTLRRYRGPAVADVVEFPDRGHSLTIDHGWREVAEACLGWLDRRLNDPDAEGGP